VNAGENDDFEDILQGKATSKWLQLLVYIERKPHAPCLVFVN